MYLLNILHPQNGWNCIKNNGPLNKNNVTDEKIER